MPREAALRYRDPLDALWTEALRQVGLELDRSDQAYATTDGRGRLSLSTAAGLDADDCLGQMILHELCHSLVQGRDSFELPDWGLCNESDRDVVLEHACLRLQAALLVPHGLRQAFAPTTDYRPYYDGLPDDPFVARSPAEAEEVLLARAGYARRTQRPWGPHLERALAATRELVLAVQPHLPSDHLLTAAAPAPERHRTGLPASFMGVGDARESCGSCQWAKPRGKTGSSLTCVVSGRKVGTSEVACAHHERQIDCLACGACCREAYDTVEVSAGDLALAHTTLLVPRSGGFDMARRDGHCVALAGGQRLERRGRPARSLPLYRPSEQPFVCAIYEDRPTSCRDFTRGSSNCLSARRAVGLSS